MGRKNNIILKLSLLLIASATTLGVHASSVTSFHIDFTSGNGTRGDRAPHTFGDYDGGHHFDDYTALYGPYADTWSFVDNGVNLEVEAGVIGPVDNDGTGSSNKTYQGGDDGVYVGQFVGGLGVGWEINDPYGDLDDDDHTVDSSNGQDFLVLNFDRDVFLTTIDLDYFGSYRYGRYRQVAQIDIFSEGQRVFRGRINGNGIETFAPPIVGGDTFIITPRDQSSKHITNFFKLRAIGGQVLSEHPGTAIPSPTAALVGGIGMIGLITRRRRRDITAKPAKA